MEVYIIWKYIEHGSMLDATRSIHCFTCQNAGHIERRRNAVNISQEDDSSRVQIYVESLKINEFIS